MIKSRKNRTVSVIIPIYNAEQFLPCLFDALSHCNFMEEDEVLLVDNGSTDQSAAICAAEAEKKPECYRCLSFTKTMGSYAARNYAIQHAKGEILIFTDSDCKPTAEWLDAIRDHVKSGIVVAGKIQIEIEDNGIWENFDAIAHLNSEKNAAKYRVATANMAVMKEDFLRVGMFEERFSGGDYDWSRRAAGAGLVIQFVSEALVLHPSRKTFEAVLKKNQRIAYGAGQHYRIQNRPGFLVFCIYFLKIFKIDTNVRYTGQLKRVGINGWKLWEFNIGFMRIRMNQFSYALKGYRLSDVRKLGIK